MTYTSYLLRVLLYNYQVICCLLFIKRENKLNSFKYQVNLLLDRKLSKKDLDYLMTMLVYKFNALQEKLILKRLYRKPNLHGIYNNAIYIVFVESYFKIEDLNLNESKLIEYRLQELEKLKQLLSLFNGILLYKDTIINSYSYLINLYCFKLPLNVINVTNDTKLNRFSSLKSDFKALTADTLFFVLFGDESS